MSFLLGDCLDRMRELDADSVDMIYLDPPFFTQKIHSMKTRDNTKEYMFEDTWDSLDEYIGYLKARLLECRRVLKTTGSIFLHCDKTASHYLRVLMDEIFGFGNFRNEIIWAFRRWSNSSRSLLSSHQTIYFYSKTNQYKFNTLFTDYSPSTNVDQILQKRERDKNGKSVYKKDLDGEVVLGDEKKAYH